ncbi:hypothetical protein BG003_003169 [Podila horticola]|nr:hypothetical protein BG003_003169 [Podila horticola]
MLANKTLNIFAIAAAFMLLVTIEAAPAAEAAVQGNSKTAEPAACVPCPQWPDCNRRCPNGFWCDFNRCSCVQTCRKGQIP